MRGDVNLRELCLEHIEIPSSEGVFATAPTGEHERRARPGRWRPLGGGRSSLRPSALPDRRNRSAVPGGGGGGARAWMMARRSARCREQLTGGPGALRLRRRPLRYGRTSRADLRRLRVSRRPPLVRRRQRLLALQSRSSAPPIAVNSVDGGPGWRLLEGEMQSQSAGAREIECVRTGRLRAAHAQGWRAPTAPSLRSPFCCVHCIDA